ncbi:helix-turn-helix transcriptional regulator [Lactococcus sp. S64]|uniref:helix-turn-helix transcriptional regulator n=1 Tax=Lactococcus sp. S64 TaxID=2767459 RepID=UPI001907ADFC|nr:helix-turn-helix transcriptional regulator [Lactococcus sp. S64]MBK0082309.1 helix-turn-helix transcriptional regulator [Lactococcus sp. S64]
MNKNFNEETVFYQRVLELSKERNMSLNALEKQLGYPRNALSNYKSIRGPSAERLLEVSSFFGVDPEYLMNRSNDKPILKLESLFSRLNLKNKREICQICLAWLSKNEAINLEDE